MFLFIISSFQPSAAQTSDETNTFNSYKSSVPGQLPRWREGGTPYNDKQSLYPIAVPGTTLKDMPSTGLIESPPEYSASRGVLFSYFSNGWPEVVRDLVVALTSDPAHDDIAYVVVANSSQMSSATTTFTNAGADMSKVEFIIEPMDAVWIRDYGPHFIWQDSAIGIVNSQYYPTRSLDNFTPALLGEDDFLMPTYDMGLYYSGGNFQPGPRRNGFMTSIVNLDNSTSAGFDANLIAELCQTYQGIDTLHVMPQLPFSVDGTGHIDMWMYIVNDTTVIISEFLPGSNATAISVTNNAVPYMEALGFTVYRTPAWNAAHPDYGYNTHWTYTNALRVNDRIFISTYGETYLAYADEDAQALAVWEAAAAPEVEIIQINSYPIIWAAGAIHCITMQVPRLDQPQPAVHVILPAGGELFVSGTTETIEWGATDSNNADLDMIVLYYTDDDGQSYELIDTTSDTGLYEWTVPDLFTEEARIKVVAVSADADETEAVSGELFQIAPCAQTVYDFSTGAGVDKSCFGAYTYNWTYIDGNRTPVASEVNSAAYSRMAYSDATGNDYDANRYTSPDPPNGFESTHIFEFTIAEDPAEIEDIGMLWEGYSDQCSMMEMYIWDYTATQWCDADALFNQNRFMDSWAGNRDGYLEKHIRSGFDRFVNPEGQFTLLLYSERGPDGSYVNYNPTFHDYIAVTVSDILPQYICGDADGSGEVNVSDAVAIINYIFVGGDPPDPLESGDTNCDGEVNVSDAVLIINYIFVGGNAPCDTDGDGVPDC
jgi:agmatine/peptidylarginine deiminase